MREVGSDDAPPPDSTRVALEMAFIGKGATFDDDDGKPHGTDPDVRAYRGCAARPNTPTQGPAPVPHHMQDAPEPAAKGMLPLYMAVPRARANSTGRERTGTKAKPVDLRVRPGSAGPRARRRCQGLLPEKPDP